MAAAQEEPSLVPTTVAAAYTLPSPALYHCPQRGTALSSAPTKQRRFVQYRTMKYRAEQYRAGERRPAFHRNLPVTSNHLLRAPNLGRLNLRR